MVPGKERKGSIARKYKSALAHGMNFALLPQVAAGIAERAGRADSTANRNTFFRGLFDHIRAETHAISGATRISTERPRTTNTGIEEAARSSAYFAATSSAFDIVGCVHQTITSPRSIATNFKSNLASFHYLPREQHGAALRQPSQSLAGQDRAQDLPGRAFRRGRQISRLGPPRQPAISREPLAGSPLDIPRRL